MTTIGHNCTQFYKKRVLTKNVQIKSCLYNSIFLIKNFFFWFLTTKFHRTVITEILKTQKCPLNPQPRVFIYLTISNIKAVHNSDLWSKKWCWALSFILERFKIACVISIGKYELNLNPLEGNFKIQFTLLFMAFLHAKLLG